MRKRIKVRLALVLAGVFHLPACFAEAAAQADASQRFAVHEYRVLGNTVLENRQIEGVLYPLLGDARTLQDVQAARTALENAYHALGFATVFVDIPPQEVNDGIVRLRVTEGRLGVRTISGARYFSEGKILEQLPSTQPGKIPQLTAMQQQLTAVNSQTADRSVTPVLKAGQEPGTMDLALKVEDHLPLHGSVDFNNQYTADTEPLRATVSLSYDNLFGALDSLGLQYTTTPQQTGQVGVATINYTFRPLAYGIRPSLSFTNSSSNVATIGTLGVLGDGQIYSGHLSIPLTQEQGLVQSLSLGLDYKHFRNTISLASAGAVIQPISYVNASLGYMGAWRSFTDTGLLRRFASFDLTMNAGPRGFANQTINFDLNRYQGRGNYVYLRSNLSFTTRLPADFQLTLRASGQFSPEPLVVYEQQSTAGADGVRGYLDAEVLGDRTTKGTLQLQSPQLSRRNFLFGDAFLFFDAGRSHYIEALSGQATLTQLRSWGLGLDLLPGHSVTGSLTWAVPLLDGPRTQAHDSRLLFDVRGSF